MLFIKLMYTSIIIALFGILVFITCEMFDGIFWRLRNAGVLEKIGYALQAVFMITIFVGLVLAMVATWMLQA